MKEIRSLPIELRTEAKAEEEQKYTIEGRAIVFGSKCDNGFFDEFIDAGALDKTDLRDVRLLLNHNKDGMPLARSRNNNENSTMQLTVDSEGMMIRADLDVENNADSKALYSAIERGDITGMSFAFTVADELWEDLESEHPTRHIRSIERVFEVSAVTWPAYEATTLEARSDAPALESAQATLESVRRNAEESKAQEEREAQEAAEEARRAEEAQQEERKAREAERVEKRSMIANGAGTILRKKEVSTMEVEIRNTPEYINAYANYIKTGKDEECRALLSTNGTNAVLSLTGYVPVPEIVDGIVRTAWEKNNVLALCRQTNLKGNVKVGFELSAGAASVHAEGASAPSEETLTLGIVEMIPESIKKWITVSDEALDLNGEDFLRYIYEELTYQIAKKAEAELIGKIAALPDTATTSSVSAANIATAPSVTAIAEAMGAVIGENLTIVMNRGTWAAFKAVQYAANFAIDIFEGQNVVFSDALPAFGSADEEDVYAIIGDFREGAQVNYPAGTGIQIKMDVNSLAEKDLVKFVGRMYAGFGAVADKRFALLSVPEEDEE